MTSKRLAVLSATLSVHQPQEGCNTCFAELKRMSDEDLMDRLQSGEHDSLTVLFGRYRKLVLSVSMRILRDVGEAEDITQEIFYEIYRVAGQFNRSRGSFKTWILQYAYHRSFNRRQYLNLRRFYTNAPIADLNEHEACFLPEVWKGLKSQEWRRVLTQGLALLNAKQRRTLELSCYEGLLLQEIADRTGESLGNVRHHYYRGLKKLTEFFRQAELRDARPVSASPLGVVQPATCPGPQLEDGHNA